MSGVPKGDRHRNPEVPTQADFEASVDRLVLALGDAYNAGENLDMTASKVIADYESLKVDPPRVWKILVDQGLIDGKIVEGAGRKAPHRLIINGIEERGHRRIAELRGDPTAAQQQHQTTTTNRAPVVASALVGHIRNLIEEAEPPRQVRFDDWHTQAEALIRAVYGADDPAVDTFRAIIPPVGSLANRYPWEDAADIEARKQRREDHRFEAGVSHLKAALLTLDIGQSPSATDSNTVLRDLHPTIRDKAAKHCADHEWRTAVSEASTAVENALKNKLSNQDTNMKGLCSQAFSLRPKAGKTYLRLTDFVEDSQAWRNQHEGAMHFGMGCAAAIRNISVHKEGDTDPKIALESLAALSLLARWIDDAELHRAPAEASPSDPGDKNN